MTKKAELHRLLKQKQEHLRYNQLDYWAPYGWQEIFCNQQATCQQLLAMCANRIGKTHTGARAMACHLTGRYPDWWKGIRFTKPINAWACGMTTETTRDVVQMELLGPPDDITQRGTYAIPKDCIGETTRRPGIPNAFSSVLVKHESGGWSRLGFKTYEQGQEKFMGASMDYIWLDEEPPFDIFTQCITRTATTGGIVAMTFTPEAGMTETVVQFTQNLKPGQFMITATWEDAPHLNERVKEQLMSVYPPHEREMRTKGIPVFGSGLVYPVHLLDEMIIEPFRIPDGYHRIVGLDFGWDHPTAAVWIAIDKETDTCYIYDEYGLSQATSQIHAAAIRARGPDIPVSWPKDGLITDKGQGQQLAHLYRQWGVNMLPSHFRNSPSVDSPQGSISKEAGIMEIYEMMEQGRVFIFDTCRHLIREVQQYHRKDGKIFDFQDDYVSAMRYGICGRRFSSPGKDKNWDGEVNFAALEQAIV